MNTEQTSCAANSEDKALRLTPQGLRKRAGLRPGDVMVHEPGDICRRKGERRKVVEPIYAGHGKRIQTRRKSDREAFEATRLEAVGSLLRDDERPIEILPNGTVVEIPADADVRDHDEYGRPHGQHYGEIKCFKVPTIGFRVWRPSTGDWGRPDGWYHNRRKGERRRYYGDGYAGIEQRKAVVDRRGNMTEHRDDGRILGVEEAIFGKPWRATSVDDVAGSIQGAVNKVLSRRLVRDESDQRVDGLIAECEVARKYLRQAVKTLCQIMAKDGEDVHGVSEADGFHDSCALLGLEYRRGEGLYEVRKVL